MEWLVFLLPVAAFSGWIAARNHYRKKTTKNEPPFNPEYFKGLNYLLNEQPDKAVDVMIPTTSTFSFTKAPPEFPGCMGTVV